MIIPFVFLVVLLIYSLASRRLEGTVLTPPILFTTVGIVIFFVTSVSQEFAIDSETFLRIAEIGLVLVLFNDAAHINRRVLRENESLPGRLLGIGMPLTVLLGAAIGAIVFPQITFWEAGILSAVLAPTDAGLGEVIVNSPLVPERIRQALNVEAGLNDGMSVPFLFFFLIVAQAGAQGSWGILITYGVEQLGFGALVGIGIGLGGGWILQQAMRRGWMENALRPVALLALPLLCIVLAEPIGGSMFIAAFVAGLAVQVFIKDTEEGIIQFSATLGQVLDYFVFFLFGILACLQMAQFGWTLVLYALLSLTVVRMVPVALAVRNTGLSRPTVWFMGWFGPRGLASIVLGLVYLAEEASLPGEPVILATIALTVLLSIYAHGLSAVPGINFYAQKIKALSPEAPEFMTSSQKPGAGKARPGAAPS